MNSIFDLLNMKGVILLPKKEIDRLEELERNFKQIIKNNEEKIAKLTEDYETNLKNIAKTFEYSIEINGHTYKTNSTVIFNLHNDLKQLETNFLDKNKQANRYYQKLLTQQRKIEEIGELILKYSKSPWYKKLFKVRSILNKIIELTKTENG